MIGEGNTLMQNNTWLPLTDYAIRSGISISTLRRKIKTNTISFKMEDGRYLIRSDQMTEEGSTTPYHSNDLSLTPAKTAATPILPKRLPDLSLDTNALQEIRQEMAELSRRIHQENSLQWRALEARVSGIAKKLEIFSEQVSELKMLVKLFEERLDNRV